MKNSIISGLMTALVLLTVPVISEAKPAPRKNIKLSNTKVVDKRTSAMNFSRIEVSRMVKLIIEDRTDNIVLIRTDENLLPYVDVHVANGKLTATISDGINISHKELKTPLVEVAIPFNGQIEEVETYGVAAVKIEPRLQVRKFEAEVYGASSFEANLMAEQCKLEIYGASKANFAFEGGQLDIELYGASAAKADVNAMVSDIEVYGASNINIEGTSQHAEIEVSGASGFRGFNFATDVCSVDVSGASTARINCRKSLKAQSSGASSLIYKGDCRISSVSTSSAGSFKKE